MDCMKKPNQDIYFIFEMANTGTTLQCSGA